MCRGLHRQRLAEGDDHLGAHPRVADLLQFLAGTGEAAAPETTQVERQNHPIHAVNHSLVAPLELAQLAATAYCTLRKQADHLTRAQQFVDPVQRIPAVTAGDGNDAKQIQKPLQIPALVDPPVHDEAHRPGAGDLDHRPVEPADVISQHQYTALSRQVVETQNLDAVGAGEQPCYHQPHQRLGQLVDGIDRTDQRGKHQQMEQPDAIDSLDCEQHGQSQKAEHHQVLHPVVARQYSAQLAIPGMELDQRIQRHDEQAAGYSEQQKIDDQRSVGVELRQEKEGRDYAQRAQRHQAGLYMVAGCLACNQGADDDADAGAGHHSLNDDRVGLPHALFDIGGKSGQHNL